MLARDVRSGERQVKAIERDMDQLSKHASVLEISRQSALTEKTLRAAVRMRNSAGGQSVHKQAERFGEQATEAAKVVDAVDVALKMNEDDEDDDESELAKIIETAKNEDVRGRLPSVPSRPPMPSQRPVAAGGATRAGNPAQSLSYLDDD